MSVKAAATDVLKKAQSPLHARNNRHIHDLIKRDKTSLDIFWLKDESLEDSANLPDADVLALEIVENLQAALEQFNGIHEEVSMKDLS